MKEEDRRMHFHVFLCVIIQKSPPNEYNHTFDVFNIFMQPIIIDNRAKRKSQQNHREIILLALAPAKECRQPDSNRHEVAPVRF